jgi:hypothetical protein
MFVNSALRCRSEISSQTGNTDTLQCNVWGTRERVRHRAGDILWRDHFVARPLAIDVSPDAGVCRRGINVDHPDLTVAQFFAHALGETFQRELAHAISAPVREPSLRCDGKNADDTGAGRHLGGKVLHEHKRRGDIDPDSLLPFNRCDFAKWLYDCDARVVHEQIQRLFPNLIYEIGNTG